MTPNIAATLKTIRHSEGSDRAADPYRVVYGFTLTLANLSDHPAITGEWTGVQTPYGHTSAAGAYQIEVRTWLECKAALRLTDFTGPSQDDAAIYLIKQRGGLALVNAGNFAGAIVLCRGIWASLPGAQTGASVGQPQRSLAYLQDFYTSAGGSLA